MPEPADAAKPTRQDLEDVPALSILLNGPKVSRAVRWEYLSPTVWIWGLLNALRECGEGGGRTVRDRCTTRRRGLKRTTGSWIEAKQKLDGGPSVFYDAVALLPSQAGAALLMNESTARDFVADAFAHQQVHRLRRCASSALYEGRRARKSRRGLHRAERGR